MLRRCLSHTGSWDGLVRVKGTSQDFPNDPFLKGRGTLLAASRIVRRNVGEVLRVR